MAVLLVQMPVDGITGVDHVSLAVLPFLLCVSFSVSAPHFTSLGSYSLISQVIEASVLLP